MDKVTTKRNGVVIGYGGMGGWHTRYLKESDAVNLLGVYDIKPERNAAAEEVGIHAYESWQAVLDDPNVDFVTIAVPNELHKPLAIEAMAHGKHVISEKPVTLSSADLQEIFDASEKYGRLFTTHQNRRWDCDYLMMKQAYASGELGKVFQIESRIQGSRGIPGDWRGKKEHGGGMILDWGVHMIDQMLQLVKSPITSLYCKTTHYTNAEVDDGYKMFIYFENGVVGYTEVGTYNFISQGRYYAQFEQGTAFIPDWHDDVLVRECLNWGEGDVHPVQTASGITKTMAPRSDASVKEYRIPQPSSDVHDFYRNLKDTIEGKAEQLIRHGEVRRVLQVMEAAFASAASNTVVKFDPAI